MTINGRGEIGSKANLGRPEPGFIGPLRGAARAAVLVGAVGSVGLMFHASQHPPRLLLVLFVIWVLAPFIALALADAASKHWPVITRATLYCVMLVVTLGGLAAYGYDLMKPPRAQAAFVFVIVPLASWLLIATAIPVAALIPVRLSRGGDGANR